VNVMWFQKKSSARLSALRAPTRRSLWIFLTMALFVAPAVGAVGAASSQAPLQEIPTQAGDVVVMKGYRGRVVFKGVPTATQLRLTVRKAGAGEGFVQVRREAQRQVVIEVVGPTEREIWIKNPVAVAEFDLQLEGPPRVVDLAWRQGRAEFLDWSQPVTAIMIQGEVDSRRSTGDWALDVHSGSVKIYDHDGGLRVTGYDPRVEIQGGQGDLRLENFLGMSRVAQRQGRHELVAHRGSISVSQGKGRVDLQNDRATIRLDDFEGAVRGVSGPGSVLAQLRGEIDVQLRSQEGDVRLRVPDSGADINVATQSGQLIVPGFLQTQRSDSVKSARGRLRGALPGRIMIRSQSGSVSVN
jgi:hypothetical protein